MSFGHGTAHFWLGKKKTNTKVLEESEIGGTSEYVTFNIWIIMFMKSQGCSVKKKFLLQENKNTNRMEVNGRNSCNGN